MPNGSARSLRWYVVQVESGQEQKLCKLIRSSCAQRNELAKSAAERIVLDECFSPRFQAQRKRKAGWTDTEYALLPGYVIAVVDDAVKLAQALRQIPEFCRTVTSGEAYVPLSGFEREWLEAHTGRGNRVVPMSFGYREGDTITVTQGPLKGQEAQIVKVKRSASLAQLEFHVGQMTIKTTVGLGIIPKPKEI